MSEVNLVPVLVVGSFVQDLTWRCAAFPAPGQTVLGRFRSGPGGKGSNQAVAVARAGAGRVAARFVGAVGADVFGTEAVKFHAAEGIESRLVVKEGAETGTAGILVREDGQNEIVVALGANELLKSGDVPDSWTRDARVVVGQCETDMGTLMEVFRAGRAAGAVTVFNPAPMREDFTADWLADVQVLVPNETEFAALLWHLRPGRRENLTEAELMYLGDAELHELCRLAGTEWVIVTLGERGCFVSGPEGGQRLPALSGVVAVDTTGAGDAFVGGLVCGLVEFDGDVRRAARLGNVVAGLSVMRTGTSDAMPRRAEVEEKWRMEDGRTNDQAP